MDKRFLTAGAVFGLFGVVIGAFATHGLSPLLDTAARNSFETGVKYQMYHALLMLILGGFNFLKLGLKAAVLYLLVFGILFFSGSIYFLATNHLTEFDFTRFALVTPFGGTLLILAWIFILIGALSLKKK